MAMKEETKQRLDRIIFWQRVKYAAIAGGIGLAVVGFLIFAGYEESATVDKVVATHMVEGAVVTAQRGYSRGSGYSMIVKLDDGRSVRTMSMLANVPFEGERVSLKELEHKSGRTNYQLNKFIN